MKMRKTSKLILITIVLLSLFMQTVSTYAVSLDTNETIDEKSEQIMPESEDEQADSIEELEESIVLPTEESGSDDSEKSEDSVVTDEEPASIEVVEDSKPEITQKPEKTASEIKSDSSPVNPKSEESNDESETKTESQEDNTEESEDISEYEDVALEASADAYSDGIYQIALAKNTNLVLDIKGASTSNKATAQLYKANGTMAQSFQLSKTSDGYYIIKNINSGKVINVAGAKFNNKTKVWQYSNDGTNACKWTLEPTGDADGSVYIKAYNTNYVLDVPGAKLNSGQHLWLYKKNNTPAQKFILKPSSLKDGWYYINGDLKYLKNNTPVTNAQVGQFYLGSNGTPYTDIPEGDYVIAANDAQSFVLDVQGNKQTNGANLHIYQYNGTGAQVFHIKPLGNGYHQITNTISGKAIDLSGNKRESGRNILMYQKNDTTAQIWRALRTDEGGTKVKFEIKGDRLFLSRNGHGKSNGTNVELRYNYSSADTWKLSEADLSQDMYNEKYFSGYYKISSKLNKNFVIDIAGASTANNAKVQLYTNNNTNAQRFSFVKINGGAAIKSYISNKYVKTSSGSSGADCLQNSSIGSTGTWNLVPTEDKDGSVYITFGKTNLVLTASSASNGASLKLQEKTGVTAQKFYIEKAALVDRVSQKARTVLNSCGWNLRSAYNWTRDNLKWIRMAQYDTKGTNWYAEYGFDNRKGDCYTYAAVFTKLARELGYKARHINGKVQLRAGYGRHSWCEIYLDGTWYVFDPEAEMEIPSRDFFKFTYGQKGTLKYTFVSVMKD